MSVCSHDPFCPGSGPVHEAMRECGCGHAVAAHNKDGCTQWRRYPEVLTARPCACIGVWKRAE